MQNKVVIITGASSGIGKACAMHAAKLGASVVISGRDLINLKRAEEEIMKINTKVLAVQCDVSNESECNRLIDESVRKFGGVDVLINNAGISMRALFADTDLNVIRKLMDINFWGTVYCTKYALPHLIKNKGSVVGVSSIAGKKGLPGRSGYSASKFAMEGFLETIRTENLKNGLHVLVACPGFTASNIRNAALSKDGSTQGESPREEQKMMSADEVAFYIFEAIKEKRRDLILTRNGKLTVWLNKFFPSCMDKTVYDHMAKEPGSPFK